MNTNTVLFNIICEHTTGRNLGLNTNFLEANLINIVCLLFGLIYLLREFLGALLVTRQQKVLSAIQESEDRLDKARVRLAESEKQFKQTEIVIKQIEQEANYNSSKS